MSERNNKPTITNGNKMVVTSPNENFILTIWGTAGTITVKRANSRGEVEATLSETYTMSGTTESISMVGFPFGCKVILETTGTFTNADVDCGKA